MGPVGAGDIVRWDVPFISIISEIGVACALRARLRTVAAVRMSRKTSLGARFGRVLGSVSGRKQFENGGLGWSSFFGATDRNYWPITDRHMEIQQPMREPSPKIKKGMEISNPFLLYKQDLLATA